LIERTPPVLRCDSVVAGYGKKEILRGVNLEVGAGEIVAVIGHNGAGKSTLLRTVFGLLPLRGGRIFLMGERMDSSRPVDLLRRGAVYAPQGNRVFADLTVQENLDVGGITLASPARRREAFERVVEMFPRLRERLGQRAGSLSGGERQMLVLANALMLSPGLLLLDEPSMGLAPPLVTESLRQIRQTRDVLGTAILIVEQKVREVLKIADQVYVLRQGEVVFAGPAAPLCEDETRLREVYL
jgi:ABC-type branched-subunit amino acid transport system ATPase component